MNPWALTWNGARTVAQLELRQRIRSTRWIVSLVVFGVVVGGISALMWAVMRENSTGFDTGRTMFGFIVFFVLFLGLLVSPTLSATAINGDRSAGTLATLQVTLLTPAEIVLGKLLAAWAASLAFLAVATPFIVWAFTMGGTPVGALLTTLLLLAVMLAVVCAIGLGFSALTSRTAGSAVLTYVTVAALSVISPIVFALSLTVVSGEEQVRVYGPDWTEDRPTACEWRTETRWVSHTERTWWLLAVNPFVIVADAMPTPDRWDYYDADPMTGIKHGVRAARAGTPAYVDECWGVVGDIERAPEGEPGPAWPWGLGANLLLGGAGVTLAVRRLRIPQRTLPTGMRVA